MMQVCGCTTSLSYSKHARVDCLFGCSLTFWSFKFNVRMAKVTHLVVDSGAFIKNAPLHELGENVYTVNSAVKEIRDRATRERLQFLPYVLTIKEPTSEAYKQVLDFSKKTGDFASLSATDLKILALTYQLEKEHVGTSHLKLEPNCEVTNKPFLAEGICGFYYPKEDSEDGNVSLITNEAENNDIEIEECENLDDKEENEDFDVENESDEGWITSKNIVEIQKKMGAVTLEEKNTCVACISTDFAVQNTLMQMGLQVLSVDGMLIKQTRVCILRCFACYKTTCDITKKFCPNCGNKTLKRVAVTLDEEGKKNIHINFRRPINVRGTRYSLPTPKGGKHSINPVLCEDQRIPQNRLTKTAMHKINVWDPNYEALFSPFAINDVYSRAASLGIKAKNVRSQRRNPNEWLKRTGNKK